MVGRGTDLGKGGARVLDVKLMDICLCPETKLFTLCQRPTNSEDRVSGGVTLAPPSDPCPLTLISHMASFPHQKVFQKKKKP